MVFFNVAFDTDNNIDFSFWRLTSLSWKCIEFLEIQTSRFGKITRNMHIWRNILRCCRIIFFFQKEWNEIMNPKYVLALVILLLWIFVPSVRNAIKYFSTWRGFFVRQFSTIKALIAFFRHLSLILSLSVQFSSRAENHITAFTQCAFDDVRECVCVCMCDSRKKPLK